MIKHLKSKLGFTLSETLVAILILMMVTSIVAAGVPLAGRVYMRVSDKSHAQAILIECITRLRDEISDASDISVSGNTVEYTNKDGVRSSFVFGNNSNVVSDRLKTDDFSIDLSDPNSLSYSDSVLTIDSMQIKKGDTTLADQEVVIRVIGK